jgi:hypothetical protein
MRLDGLTVVPKYARTTVTLDSGLGLVTSSADVTVLAGSIPVSKGPLALVEGDVTGKTQVVVGVFLPPTGANIGGLPLLGVVSITVNKDRAADLKSTLGLGGILDEGAGYLPSVDAPAELKTTLNGGLQYDSIALTADDIWFGPVELKHLSLGYSPTADLWQGAATLLLPTPNPLEVGGTLAIQHGQFKSASASVDNLNVDLGSGVFLQRVSVSMAVNPLMLGGGIGISLGPQVAGYAAVKIDGNFSYTYSDPGLLHVDGALQMVGIPVASAFVNYRTSGEVDFGGELHLGLPNPAALKPEDQPVYIKGFISGFVDGTTAFDVEAGVQVSLKALQLLTLKADLLVSNIGVAGCGQVGFIDAGFGYTWATHHLTLMGPWLCDVGPWRSANPVTGAADVGRSAAATPSGVGSITLAQGSSVLKLTGRGGLPKVVLTGPGGQHVAVPTGSTEPVVNSRYVILQDPSAGVTYIGIHHGEGRWNIALEPGSAPVTGVQSAGLLPQPSVQARVSGRGRMRTLSWTVRREPDQTVTFYEQTKNGQRVLTSTTSATGHLRFAIPADEPGGPQTVVAEVFSHGMPRAHLTVASLRAPAPLIPGRPRHLRVKAAPQGGVTVTWSPAQNAQSYLVRLAIAHGPVIDRLLPGTARQVTITSVARITSARVTVTARRTDGASGPAASATFSTS